MIRLQSLQFSADKDTHMMFQIGWWDPEMKIPRPEMTKRCMEALKAFQVHIRLKNTTFDVEYMARFMLKRKELGENVAKVIVFDGRGGTGVEVMAEAYDPLSSKAEFQPDAPPFDIEEFKTRIRGYSDEQLSSLSHLASVNDHQDVVSAVADEVERRKV